MSRALAALLLGLALLVPAAGAAPQRASLPEIEQEVMCTTCGVPLAVAESAQAERERDYVRSLIAKGETKAQIKRDLVAQYGPQVLALPKSSGFNLAVYLVPIALVLAVAAMLAVALPRWRRRTTTAAATTNAAPTISAAESDRLDDDLAHYRG
jgi:cytochrome c-type biogenesis protein CcmH/NrfF